jgi:hypothetical protein
MGTIHRFAISNPRLESGNRKCLRPVTSRRSPFTFAFLLLLFALFLSGCTSTQPVAKLGLLAPFEGVYRQEGYEALAAMRAAIAEQSLNGIDVLPLALDTSRGVERSAQKVLADPSVAVVIGPYWMAEGFATGQLIADEKWLHPYAPAGSDAWASSAVATAAAFAKREGRALVLAGVPTGWPEADSEFAATPGDVQANQSVLWLGDAAAGADFALAVWERLPDTPMGLYGAGAATLRQRVGERMTGSIFLVGWIDDVYPEWAQNHKHSTPSAYIVYRQTTNALHRLTDRTVTTSWQPAIFIPGTDGTLTLSSSR